MNSKIDPMINYKIFNDFMLSYSRKGSDEADAVGILYLKYLNGRKKNDSIKGSNFYSDCILKLITDKEFSIDDNSIENSIYSYIKTSLHRIILKNRIRQNRFINISTNDYTINNNDLNTIIENYIDITHGTYFIENISADVSFSIIIEKARSVLSEDRVKILKLILLDYNQKEISNILKISEARVSQKIKSMRRALGKIRNEDAFIELGILAKSSNKLNKRK